ncbi:MAG: response regulator, partial [Gammaproteobacteria bacterium]
RGRRLAVRRGDPLVFTSIQGLADIHWGERHACAELSQAVLHGKADAMLCDMDSLDRELDLRRAGLELAYQRLEPLNLHFVLRDDWPELKSAINKALALFSVHDRLLINNDNASLAVSDASFPELSAEEQAFIDGKSRRLTYCHCQGRPPLDALRGGLHQGINRDFLTLFGRKLGVQFIPLPSVDNLNAMERAARGECDLLIGAEPRVHGVQGLVFTSPYRSSVQVLLGLKERDFVGSLSVLDERSIGVPSKSRITETLSARFPTMRLVPYDGSEDMAKAIRQRRVHAAVAPLEQAAELVDSNAGEFRIIGTLEQSFDMAMATRVDQLLLHGILQKAVVSISAAERDAIHGRRTRFTVEQGVDFTELWQLLGVALLILTLLAYRQYGLARLNRRLMQARDAAESANAAKTLAVASISHDLRTPVNAILGHAHVIYANPAKARESSAVIQESARHMASLLNDLLDLSKLEEGHVELTPEPIELIPFIRGVASLCRENAKARGLKLNLRLVEPLPRVVELDQTRLRQVLVNLLSNAIKYTDQGSVTLGVMSLSQAKPGEHRIRFQVDDTGPGIPEDQREKIFDTFARGDLAREGGEGSGLGLSISKGLVALMGDRLWVLSQVGKGSHFGFELNLPTRHAAVAGVARQPETPGSVTPHTETLRVLVVDDSRINREVTQELLRLFSIEVELAESASQALKLARASRFDLVLMDIEMPGMDGIGLMDRLRDENLIPGVPVIAMTAHAGEAHRQRFLAAGMNDHLPKPVEPEAMKAIVERWTGRTLRMESVDMENATDLPQLEHVNTEAGLRHWGGNASDYLNALIEASVIVAGWSAAIRQEAEAEQRQSLAKRAHRILGMAAYLGAEDLERAARVLGEDLEAKASGSTWFTSAKALADSLDQLLISLEALPEQEEPTASGDRQSLLKELLGCLEAGDFESDLVAQKLSRISKAGADAGIQHIVELVKVFKYDEAAQAVRQLLP